MWRPILIAVCVLAGAVSAVFNLDVWLADAGTTGMTVDHSCPFLDTIIAVAPNSAAARDDVRVGDRLDARRLGPSDRWRLFEFHFRAERTTVAIERGTRSRVLALVTEPDRITFDLRRISILIGFVALEWVLAFSLVVGLRAPADRRVRLMVGTFVLMMLGTVFSPGNFATGLAMLDVSVNVLGAVASGAAGIVFVLYALAYVADPKRLRLLAGVTVVVIVLDTLVSCGELIGTYLGTVDYTSIPVQLLVLPFDLAAPAFVIATYAAALFASAGEARSRLAWSGAPWIMLIGIDAINEALNDVAPQLYTGDIVTIVGNVTLALAPVGLTYALFSRRILDIGFALNRAAVFAATTVVLAGVFAALQWLASTLLTGVFHAHGLVADGVIVLIVYYVVQRTRRNTDAFVTRVFFATRDRRLRAMRAMLRALDEVRSAENVAPFVVETLRANAAVDASVFLHESGRFVATAGDASSASALDEDDPHVVALRAAREPVVSPAFSHFGDVASPMLVRGRLRGILFARALDGSDLAPDEIALLSAIGDRAAGNRDDLLADALRGENQTLRDELTRLRVQQSTTS